MTDEQINFLKYTLNTIQMAMEEMNIIINQIHKLLADDHSTF